MRPLNRIIICLSVILISYNSQIAAQQYDSVPVEISSEKVNIKGTVYYVHKVLKRQTLYSISKSYGVTIETILSCNPSIDQGLKEGSLIMIPLSGKVANNKATEKKRATETNHTIKHTVKWYENLSDIAKKYNVPREAILKANGLDESVSIEPRQVLIIPISKSQMMAMEQKREEERLIEEKKAEKKLEEERLEAQRQAEKRLEEERLAAQRSEEKRIAEEEKAAKREEEKRIEREREKKRAEQKLEEKRIAEEKRLEKKRLEEERAEQKRLEQQQRAEKRAEERRIAKEQERLAEERRIAQQQEKERLAEEKRVAQQQERERLAEERRIAQQQTVIEEPKFTQELKEQETKNEEISIEHPLYKVPEERTYTISIVLPLNSEQNPDANQMDFYSGALLALKEFREISGTDFYSLNIVDLSLYPSSTDMIDSGVLDNSEVIIGPVFEQDLRVVSQYANSHKIPLVSPLDTKAERLVANNPYFFQYPATHSSNLANIIDRVSDNSSSSTATTLIIYESGYRNSTVVNNVFNGLYERQASFDSLSYGILEGRAIDTKIREKLILEGTNRVVVASESEAFVTDVLRNLNLVAQADNKLFIEVYGQPKWKNFETIEPQYFHSLNTHLSLQYHIDYNQPATMEFINNYRSIFKAEPTPFAYQGHDVVLYFLSALNEFGREFPAFISSYRKSMLQGNVHFVKKEHSSGFMNYAPRNILFRKGWDITFW